jgi:hypothetical protein
VVRHDTQVNSIQCQGEQRATLADERSESVFYVRSSPGDDPLDNGDTGPILRNPEAELSSGLSTRT